jgi:hypothetical protein
MALFRDATRAESSVESLWRRGFEPDRLSLLAREPGRAGAHPRESVPDWQRQKAVSPHLWFRFQRSAVVRLPHLGLVVALGPIAEELAEGPASKRGEMRLPLALRRLGLAATRTPRFEEALHHGLIVLSAAVDRAEAQDWAALLQRGGAVSLTAHLRLEPWPIEKRGPRGRHAARRGPRHHEVVT